MISVTLVNAIALIILGISTFTWRLIYPKKKLNLLVLLLIFACIPMESIWRKGSYQSGDFSDHIYFFMSFYHSLQDGIWFPRWSGGFCGGYGYPHIQYFYHLPYYLESFFHYFFRLSFIDSQKMLICLSFLGAAISMYAWLKSEWGKLPAFFGSILYILSPYLLAGAHFRVTLGEGLGTFLVPIMLWCINLSFSKKKQFLRYIWLITPLYILLILAHHVVPILSLPFVVSYFLMKFWQSKIKSYSRVLFFFVALGLSFLMTSYHWAPILLEQRWILQNNLKIIEFPAVSMYFYSPWRFGLLNQGHFGELSWTVGYVQWFTFLVSFAYLFLKRVTKSDKHWFRFFLAWFVLLFLFLMPVTQPIWVRVPLMKNFQFANRLLFLINILIGAVAALCIKNLPILYSSISKSLKKSFPNLPSKLSPAWLPYVVLIMIVGTCGATILNWGHRAMITDLDDRKLELQLPQWCDQVAIPNWVDEQTFKHLPKRIADMEVISGAALITEKSHAMEFHEYSVAATAAATLRENTTYFPGWTAYIDGKSTPISYDDPIYFGIMKINISQGMHQVVFKYEHTPIQLLFEKISLLGLGIWSIVTAVCLYQRRHD